MGFFGFLKKDELKAPLAPAPSTDFASPESDSRYDFAANTSPRASSNGPDPFGIPELDENTPPIPPPDLLDVAPPPAQPSASRLSPQEEQNLPFKTQPSGRARGSGRDILLPDFTQEEIDAAHRLAEEELLRIRDGLREPEAADPQEPSLPEPAQPEPKAPEVAPPPVEPPAPKEEVREPVVPVQLPPPSTLPKMKDAEGLLPMLDGQTLYVPGVQYKQSLTSLRRCKESVRKGETSVRALLASYAAHKQPYAQFADKLNTIQESLIRMDNRLMR